MAGQRFPDRGAVGQPPHPHRAVIAAADDDRGAVRQRPTATALTEPPWPRSGSPTGVPSASRHTRTVPSIAAADDDRGAVRQRPGRHRVHRAAVTGEHLVAGGSAAMGPAGLPGPVGGGARDAGGQAAAAEAVSGQFELAGPLRRVEVRARWWALCRYTAAVARAGADRAASRWGTSRAGSTVIR